MEVYLFTENDSFFTMLNTEAEKFAISIRRVRGRDDIEAITQSEHDGMIFVDEDVTVPNECYDMCISIKRSYRTGVFLCVLITACENAVDTAAAVEYYQFDDFLIKPFPPRCFIAKIRALQRIRKQFADTKRSDVLKCGPVALDPGTLALVTREEKVSFTKNQFDVLYSLAANLGRTMSRSEIIEAVRGDNYSVVTNAVNVEISRIRKKIPDGVCAIKTVRRVGYRFEITKKKC